MNTLGFTTEYYTLWEVSEPIKRYGAGAVINGVFHGTIYWEQACIYMQNLSKDYDKAVKKIAALGEFAEDLDLRGHSSFVRNVKTETIDYPDHIFPFGQLTGQDIRECDNVWQLTRTMNDDKNKRRRVIARHRLIELGELIRNTSFPGEDRYIVKGHFRRLKERADEQLASGHFFEAGKRIQLTVRRIGGFGYETQYGMCFIEKYITEAGQLIKYKGSSPLQLPDGFCAVAGMVEHSEYNGQPETRLKRMKLVSAC
jgi:hypothetical protein